MLRSVKWSVLPRELRTDFLSGLVKNEGSRLWESQTGWQD